MSGSLFDQYKAALRRGHLAALAGNLDDALAAYGAASRLVPERALPVASQGTVLHRLDRWPEAAAAFEQALQLAPDDEATLRARAAAREERGLRSGAATDLERLAVVLDLSGRGADAADVARRAANLEPSATREALADRLGAAAALRAEYLPGEAPTPQSRLGQVPDRDPDAVEARGAIEEDEGPASVIELGAPESPADSGWWDRPDAPADPAAGFDEPEPPAPPPPADPYDLDEALRASARRFEDELRTAGAEFVDDDTANTAMVPFVEPDEDEDALPAPGVRHDAVSAALTARLAELGTQPAWVDMEDSPIRAALGDLGPDGQPWPLIDLPSPPPPPMEGPPPDPEALLAEAVDRIATGDPAGARDLMLTAVMVHRAANRLDAALEICLQLLTTAPGDPQVHLAIANLQLDRGWTGLATEKIELLLRLTSLTGDTQAEADVHGLASERLRDVPTVVPLSS